MLVRAYDSFCTSSFLALIADNIPYDLQTKGFVYFSELYVPADNYGVRVRLHARAPPGRILRCPIRFGVLGQSSCCRHHNDPAVHTKSEILR